MIRPARTRVAYEFVLFVQPDVAFNVQRRLAHSQGPTIPAITHEVRLMDRPASRPGRGKSRPEEILNLGRLVVILGHGLNSLDEGVNVIHSLHVSFHSHCAEPGANKLSFCAINQPMRALIPRLASSASKSRRILG